MNYFVHRLSRPALLMGIALSLAVPSRPATLRVPQQYPSIQSAVNAANDGDTVLVASRIYQEQVLILSKDIRLTAPAGATIKAPPGFPPPPPLPPLSPPAPPLPPPPPSAFGADAMIAVSDADVTLQGFAIDASSRSAGSLTTATGVLYNLSGGSIRGCTIKSADRFFNPITVDNQNSSTPRSISIRDNVIRIAGSPAMGAITTLGMALTVDIRGNAIIGAGISLPGIVQNGIYLLGGTGQVRQNLIQDMGSDVHLFDGFYYGRGTGITIYNADGLQVQGNVITGTELGLDVYDVQNLQIVGNTILGPMPRGSSGNAGIDLSGNNNEVVGNTLVNVEVGVHLYSGTTYTRIITKRVWFVTKPLLEEPGVVGTRFNGNKTYP